MRTDAFTFIDAWMDAYNNGGNQTTVANKLGCSPANVSLRAKRFREQGVELPDLVSGKGGSKLDIVSLNERLRWRMNVE